MVWFVFVKKLLAINWLITTSEVFTSGPCPAETQLVWDNHTHRNGATSIDSAKRVVRVDLL